MTTPLYLTIDQACETYALGRTKIYDYINAGQLKKYGPRGVRRTLLSVAELDALMQRDPPVTEPAVAAADDARPLEPTVRFRRITCRECGAPLDQLIEHAAPPNPKVPTK